MLLATPVRRRGRSLLRLVFSLTEISLITDRVSGDQLKCWLKACGHSYGSRSLLPAVVRPPWAELLSRQSFGQRAEASSCCACSTAVEAPNNGSDWTDLNASRKIRDFWQPPCSPWEGVAQSRSVHTENPLLQMLMQLIEDGSWEFSELKSFCLDQGGRILGGWRSRSGAAGCSNPTRCEGSARRFLWWLHPPRS